eukprot:TRINITY_DN7494_c0_g2_i2.p1 TRINITY_DN7494_c0_g2~~TRINITY_DN7494_c0_g2_i2.p1  ORF type:complete len:112 (+),score=26.27 TRINITY_DN7494_c0_g2_i2:162-497(+)
MSQENLFPLIFRPGWSRCEGKGFAVESIFEDRGPFPDPPEVAPTFCVLDPVRGLGVSHPKLEDLTRFGVPVSHLSQLALQNLITKTPKPHVSSRDLLIITTPKINSGQLAG